MTRIVIRGNAKADLASAAKWYELRVAGLGDAFLTAAEHSIGLIASRPLAIPIIHQDVRRLRVKRFPYAVYFVLKSDAAIIVAVLHNRQDRESHLQART